MVRLSELETAPLEEKKNYVFPSNKSLNGPKKEWQLERERRKLRAQKKEQRRKQIDENKESEKNKWLSFNAKANAKNLKVKNYNLIFVLYIIYYINFCLCNILSLV